MIVAHEHSMMKLQTPLRQAEADCILIRNAIQRELPYPQKMALKVVDDIRNAAVHAIRGRTFSRQQFEKLRDKTRALRTFGFSEDTKVLVDRLQEAFSAAIRQRKAG